MPLPTFLIIGSQKCGTTTLHRLLFEHPQVFMPRQKEINYFFLDDLYQQGPAFYSEYFLDAPADTRALGEASPGYICHPHAPKRIATCVPNAKLILILRDPIDRAYSQYWDNRRRLAEHGTFADAISRHLRTDYVPGEIGYFSRGVYSKYIKRFLEYFDKRQLLILFTDDLKGRPRDVYSSMCEWLGIEKTHDPCRAQLEHNKAYVWNNILYRATLANPSIVSMIPPYARKVFQFGQKRDFVYPNMSDRARKILIEFYKPWNDELSIMCGRNLDRWNAL